MVERCSCPAILVVAAGALANKMISGIPTVARPAIGQSGMTKVCACPPIGIVALEQTAVKWLAGASEA
jgi:hypothetical protein